MSSEFCAFSVWLICETLRHSWEFCLLKNFCSQTEGSFQFFWPTREVFSLHSVCWTKTENKKLLWNSTFSCLTWDCGSSSIILAHIFKQFVAFLWYSFEMQIYKSFMNLFLFPLGFVAAATCMKWTILVYILVVQVFLTVVSL